MVSKTVTQIKRFMPTPQTWRIITIFLLRLLLVLVILFFFKVIFFTSCLSVGNIQACATADVQGTTTLFAIGAILVAIVALIPMFWTDNKITDAKNEIIREVTEHVQGDMQRLNQAQILIFEADRYQNPPDLISRERMIEGAIRLWPLCQQDEHKKLGNSFSLAVIGEFYQGPTRSKDLHALQQGLALTRDQIQSYLNKAIFYLEETVRNSEKPDRDTLVNLACMYGCDGRYDEMIRVIEQAIKADENAQDDFQESKRLSLLMRACGTDRRKIEKLGNKIGKELPVSKTAFIRIINRVDRENRQSFYIHFFALRRQARMTQHFEYLIKIALGDVQGKRLVVTGLYYPVFDEQHFKDLIHDQPISVEEVFDEVDKELYVICSPEE